MAGTLIVPTFKVPLPCPPVGAPHALQVMPVTVIAPVAHPTVIFVGRVRGVDPGPQERTTGREVTLVVVRGAVVVDTFAVLVEPPMAADLFDWGEDLEPMLKPMAVPTPRAARTSATMPIRTTVLRCTVITGSLPTTKLTVVRESKAPKSPFVGQGPWAHFTRWAQHGAALGIHARDEKPILAKWERAHSARSSTRGRRNPSNVR